MAAVASLGCLFFAAQADNAGSQNELGHFTIIPNGAVEGGDLVAIPRGDIINVRNIQGGVVSNYPSSVNLDIGAGSSTHRGNLGFNYDVGKCSLFYDGHKVKQVVICPGKRPWARKAWRIGGRPPQ